MPRIVIIFSLLLIGLGLIAYFLFADAGNRSVTALIPAFAGVPILLCGLIGLHKCARKIAMHVAMVFALVGFIAPLRRLIPTSIKNGFEFDSKSGTMIAMSALCLILLILGIRSFIAARRGTAAG
ncbi:MAG: hypothetical protein OSA40_13240 [Phycisphaerales bacterium]|nr:hypothetical protein [Phycisphaerales bacterium]